MQPHLANNAVSNDVKLDTLGEPNALLISDNVTLPEDCFSSYLNYLLYEMAHYKLLSISFLLILVSVLIIVLFHNVIACNVVFGLTIFLSFFTILAALMQFSMDIEDDGFEVKLLLEVITRKPDVKGKEWRIITHNMNQYLFDNGLWNTHYFFYCDERCYKFFRSLVRGKNRDAYVNSSTNGAENTQSETPANEVFNEVLNEASICFGSRVDPILEAYFIKAAEVEKEAQRRYWRKQYPDAVP